MFLDELPEFKREVLEVMRQPLEDREVTISRAKFTVTYPSSFMLVASMNPSPSGYFNEMNESTGCTSIPPGFYILNGIKKKCKRGHTCGGQNVQPVPCSKGTYTMSYRRVQSAHLHLRNECM